MKTREEEVEIGTEIVEDLETETAGAEIEIEETGIHSFICISIKLKLVFYESTIYKVYLKGRKKFLKICGRGEKIKSRYLIHFFPFLRAKN